MTKTTVLIVEGCRFYRELIASLLERNEIRTVSASNGAEGLRMIGEHDVQLLLLDANLPSMSGLEFLQHVRQAGKGTSAIILTDVLDKESVIRAAKLRVRDFLLMSDLSTDRLIERVKTGCLKQAPPPTSPSPHAAVTPFESSCPIPPSGKSHIPVAPQTIRSSGVPQLLTREQTLKRLETVAGGKTIAGVVAQVISIASSPDANLSELVRVIQGDPILAARVLQLANSAATGGRHRVNTIDDAARSIGLRGIQNMAISIGIFGMFPPDEVDGFNSMRCWQHSFAVAELMGMIVREPKPCHEGLNHLVGLCHELGELLLRQHFKVEYEQVQQIVKSSGLNAAEVVAQTLGVRQPELVSRLLARIGLPSSVSDAIREFHERQIRENANGMSPQAQLLQMANLIAHGLLITPSIHELVRPISRTEWRCLSPDKAPPILDPTAKRNEMVLATIGLAHLSPRDETQFLKPILPRTGLKLAYVRPPLFIDLDPLGYALQMFAETTIVTELEQIDTLAELDGVVVTGLRWGLTPAIPEELNRLTISRAQIPILVLTSNQAALNCGESIDMSTYPLPLAKLHSWLLEVNARKQL